MNPKPNHKLVPIGWCNVYAHKVPATYGNVFKTKRYAKKSAGIGVFYIDTVRVFAEVPVRRKRGAK